MGTGNVHHNPKGLGGYSHKWTIQACATQQGMVSDSEKGIKNHPLHLQKGYMLFQFDSGKGFFFPPVPNFSQSTLGANPSGGGTPM